MPRCSALLLTSFDLGAQALTVPTIAFGQNLARRARAYGAQSIMNGSTHGGAAFYGGVGEKRNQLCDCVRNVCRDVEGETVLR